MLSAIGAGGERTGCCRRCWSSCIRGFGYRSAGRRRLRCVRWSIRIGRRSSRSASECRRVGWSTRVGRRRSRRVREGGRVRRSIRVGRRYSRRVRERRCCRWTISVGRRYSWWHRRICCRRGQWGYSRCRRHRCVGRHCGFGCPCSWWYGRVCRPRAWCFFRAVAVSTAWAVGALARKVRPVTIRCDNHHAIAICPFASLPEASIWICTPP